MRSATTCGFTFILLIIVGPSLVLSHWCNVTNEDAVQYIVTQDVQRVIKLLSNHYDSGRNYTLIKKLLGNISSIMLHGSDMIKLLPRHSYENYYMSDLNATIATLREWYLISDQFWKTLQKNVTSLSNR
ncbi:uncharacterized protein LOC134194547 [Corticium candelabrum]|uniref:uncharacterized protein LOC134194547 n=1 Tax=Corticium candelabrum TaxID=121492 RepID=UPI002E26C06B|nr:uncharacterized protein LOC134194547 [Corticium candelabrum]